MSEWNMYDTSSEGNNSNRSPSSSIIVLWKALHQSGRGGFSTVPSARFYVAGGGGDSLPSPVLSFIWQGGTALYGPLCSGLYSKGGTAHYRLLYSVLYRS